MMSERLDKIIAEHFEGVPDQELIRRMERAEDFKYDDESYELSRRLGARALDWRWSDDFHHPRVVVYDPNAEGQPEA